MARTGIYSGTFDPVHAGHVGFAETALLRCGLDRVVFLPEREPRGKHGVGDFMERVKAIQSLLLGRHGFDVLVMDEAQFTVDGTLPQLQQHFSGEELVFLMGSDVAKRLHMWPEMQRLKEVVVGLRGGDAEAAIEAGLSKLAGVRYSIVESPFAAVSSSMIRKQKGRV